MERECLTAQYRVCQMIVWSPVAFDKCIEVYSLINNVHCVNRIDIIKLDKIVLSFKKVHKAD